MEEEGDILREEAKLEFDLEEVMDILSSVSLTSVVIRDFLVVMKSDFDLTITGEPFIGLTLLLNLKTGKYLSRIWNQTVATGNIVRADQFTEVCKDHFCQGRPCLGCPVKMKDEIGEKGFLISQTPIPRKIAPTCHKLLGKEALVSVSSCSECSKLTGSGVAMVDEAGRQGTEATKTALNECVSTSDCDLLEENGNLLTKAMLLNPDDIQDSLGIERNIEDKSAKSKSKGRVKSGRNLKCPWCEVSYKTDSIHYHKISVHFWGRFRCPECDSKANFAKDLVEHLKQVHHSNHSLILCPRCSDKFSMEEIASHYEDCIKVYRSSSKRKIISDNRKERITEKRRGLHCQYCSISFKQDKDLVHHNREVHQEATNYCCDECTFETTSKASLAIHTNKHKLTVQGDMDYDKVLAKCETDLPNVYKCPKCAKNIKRKDYFLTHIKTQHLFGHFSCLQCGTSTDYAGDLVEHMKENNHIQDPFLQCPLCCDKVPINEIESHHKECKYKEDKEKRRENVMCTTCGKLVRKRRFHFHQRVHMREEGVSEVEANTKLYYYCDKCGKKMSSLSNLNTHKRFVHNTDPIACPVCSVIFPNPSKLKTHQRNEHKPQKQCDYCDYKTSLTNKLKTHMATHDDPQYQCGYCKKLLKSKISLAAHERAHTGAKPFECDVCGKGFKSSGVLLVHKQGVHNIFGPKHGQKQRRTQQRGCVKSV